MMIINKLIWDSNFFNYNVGSIDLDHLNITKLKIKNDFKLIYVFSKEYKQIFLNDYYCNYEENKIIFNKIIKNETINVEPIYSIKDISINIEELYNLAYESGKYSRFKLDSNFSENEFIKLYKLWIDNSINFHFANNVFIYLENNVILGFITYKINNNFATVGLFAISKNYQGKSIGTKLLNYLEQHLIRNNIFEIQIPTQLINIPACNFYKKNGYTIFSTINIKHLWKK